MLPMPALAWIPGFIRDKAVEIVIYLVGAVLLGWLGIELTGTAPNDPPMPLSVRVAYFVMLASFGACAIVAWHRFRLWLVLRGVDFIVDCRFGKPPSLFPPDRRILIMWPAKIKEDKAGSGLLDIPGDPGSPALGVPVVNSVMSYRCELICSAPMSLFDVAVTFNLRFKNSAFKWGEFEGVVFNRDDSEDTDVTFSRTWTFHVPHLAPGECVAFYAFNNWIPEHIEMTARDTTFKTSPKSKPHTTSVTMTGIMGERIALSPLIPQAPPAPASHTAPGVGPIPPIGRREAAEIVFDPSNVKHVQPGKVDMAGASAGSEILCAEYIYALGIVSRSGRPIRCRFVLEHSVPHDTAEQRLERSMKVRNDPNPQSEGYFTLNPGDGHPGAYVEVLQELVPRQPDLRAEIQLTYANTLRASQRFFTDRGEHRLTFRLEGDFAGPIRYTLSVGYESARRRWRVSPVPLPTESLADVEIVEAYAEIAVTGRRENAFDVALTVGRNVEAVLLADELPGKYRIIWSEPFASTGYIVNIEASRGLAVREDGSRRTEKSIVIYFGLEEKVITVTAKGRRAAHA